MRRTPESRVAKAPAFEPPRYIAIEGPIRVGKSTLARFLADRTHAHAPSCKLGLQCDFNRLQTLIEVRIWRRHE